MSLSAAPANPSDAASTARILRKKSALLPSDFAKLDKEAKKRAITVTDEVSIDAIRSMRDALAKAKADGIEYREFVKTIGPTIHAQWGVDSPQLKTVFVNNVQQAANQAIVARLNRQRGKYPYWTLDVVHDEVTSATCSYFLTHPIVLPAGHSWWATNAPMRHHRCRSTLRGLTSAEAKKIGITKEPPKWPAEPGWGGSAPLGEYKANMSDRFAMAARYESIDFSVPKGVREEAQRGLDWRKEFGRGGTAVGVATARTLVSSARVSPQKARHIARYFPRHEIDKQGKGYSPGEEGFPSNGRIAWALWGGDAGRAWSSKLVKQMDSADKKATAMKDKTVKGDLGQGDVHQDATIETRKMAPITAEQRKELPAERFALPSKRAYPIHDASHARNAMARLEQNKGRLSTSEYAEAKRNILKAYKKFGIKHEGKTLTKRFKGLTFRTNAKLTSIQVHHMSDRAIQCAGVEIDRAMLADDAGQEPPRLVWIQLAKCGTFRGHPAGPFELTPQIFAEIVANFRATQNKRIPIDFEHASEQDPTQGAIPTEGAPAQGWILDLDNRGAAGLWGLVEWLEPLRTYIKQGKYKFFSPAIRFGSKDRVTGQPIGARMTSGAATNNPFLDGMTALAASDRAHGGHVESTVNVMGSDYAHSMNELAPKLRACLFEPGTHQASMGSLAECYDAVCRLEALVDEFKEAQPDADLMTAKHAGIDLGGALMRVRDAMQMGLGATVPDMLAIVKEMIETAMGVHEEEAHDEEIPPSSREMGNTTMADQEMTIKLRDAESKVVALMSDIQARDTKIAGLELTLKDREAAIGALNTELATLRDNEKKRADADEKAAVDAAFETYQDAKKLTDLDKAQMLLTYRGDRDLFHKLYPAVRADQRHLQRNLSARQSPATQSGNVPPMAAPPAVMLSQNAWNGQNGAMVGVQAPPQQKRAYAEQLAALTEEKVRKGVPREQAVLAARRELTQAPPAHT